MALLFITAVSFAQASSSLLIPSGGNFVVYNSGSQQYILTMSRLTEMNLYNDIRTLSSAKRIVSASDDPAGMAVAEKMDTYLKSILREAMNEEDYRNYLNYCEAMIGQDIELLQRIRDIILRSSNGILGPDDREIIQTEIDELMAQIDMNAEFSQFNKKRVIKELNSRSLGIDSIDVVHNVEGSMGLADSALAKLIKLRSLEGIKSNVLMFRIKGKYVYYINLQSAQSRISDLDMAEGISALIKDNLLLQSQYGIILRAK